MVQFTKGENAESSAGCCRRFLTDRACPESSSDRDQFGYAVALADRLALGAAAGCVVVGAPEDIPEDAEGEVVTGTATLYIRVR